LTQFYVVVFFVCWAMYIIGDLLHPLHLMYVTFKISLLVCLCEYQGSFKVFVYRLNFLFMLHFLLHCSVYSSIASPECKCCCNLWGFCNGVAKEIVAVGHEIASTANWIPVFLCNTVFSSSRVINYCWTFQGHFFTPWIWGHYFVSVCCNLITHWCCIASQK